MSMIMKKITPVLMVDAIEPCLAFWERLGFENVAQVPHGDRLGFVILVKNEVEIMYQSRASVAEDAPSLAAAPMGGSMLFIEVTELDAVIALLGDAPVTFPRRTTFYGMNEIGVREPGGNMVTFAEKSTEG
ncbi:MAG: hypothetical protein K8S21_08030 [Gemmatimonadetes bacterium]|nr:hypothetical protein [Gemmatimonadota bacterium]